MRQLVVSDLALLLSLLLPFKVYESNVFMIVLPVHADPPLLQVPDKFLFTGCPLPFFHDGKGNVLNIAFGLPGFGFFQFPVLLFCVCGCFFPVGSLESLSLFRYMQPMRFNDLVRQIFHFLILSLALPELVPILKTYRVHNEMRMYMIPVFVRSYQHFKALELVALFDKLLRDLVRLLRCQLLVLVEALDIVLVCPALGLSPCFLGQLHFLCCSFRLAVVP